MSCQEWKTRVTTQVLLKNLDLVGWLASFLWFVLLVSLSWFHSERYILHFFFFLRSFVLDVFDALLFVTCNIGCICRTCYKLTITHQQNGTQMFIFILLNFPLRLWRAYCLTCQEYWSSVWVACDENSHKTPKPSGLLHFFPAADHDSWPQINLSKWLGNSGSHQWFPYTGWQNGQVQYTSLLFISFHLLQFVDARVIYYDIFLSTKRLLINNNVFIILQEASTRLHEVFLYQFLVGFI